MLLFSGFGLRQENAFFILLLSAFVHPGWAQVEGDPIPLQTCFDFTGRPLTNNTQCPGSNACCHYLHQCTSNLLCTQDGSDEFVNSLCAVNPWRNCSNICQYGANRNGFLPRVRQCEDGSYCCDTDPTCCAYGRGTFLDGWGNIVSQQNNAGFTSLPVNNSVPTQSLPNSTGTTITEATAIPPGPTQEQTSTTLTPTSAPVNEGGSQTLPVVAKVGIGLSVSFSVLSFIALSILLVLRRKRNKLLAQNRFLQPPRFDPPMVSSPWLVDSTPRYELQDTSIPVEMPADTLDKRKIFS